MKENNKHFEMKFGSINDCKLCLTNYSFLNIQISAPFSSEFIFK